MKSKCTLLLISLVLTFNAGKAQNDCYCCSPAHQAFDFWVGEWIVIDSTGKKLGENSLEKVEGNCILRESWKGAQGITGSSINFYDQADSAWHQVWVDSQGTVLRLKGNIVGKSMVLKSGLIEARGRTYYNQISWIPNADGTIKQLWEAYDTNDQLIGTVFEGIYHRKE